ncbi:MAG: hypothetical protein ACXVI3_02790 [Halobacteriota archaeon]
MNKRTTPMPTGSWSEYRMTQQVLDVLIADMPYHRECRCQHCGTSFQRHSFDRISDEGMCPECSGTEPENS